MSLARRCNPTWRRSLGPSRGLTGERERLFHPFQFDRKDAGTADERALGGGYIVGTAEVGDVVGNEFFAAPDPSRTAIYAGQQCRTVRLPAFLPTGAAINTGMINGQIFRFSHNVNRLNRNWPLVRVGAENPQ